MHTAVMPEEKVLSQRNVQLVQKDVMMDPVYLCFIAVVKVHVIYFVVTVPQVDVEVVEVSCWIIMQ